MSKIKELIIATVLPAIKTAGKIEMESVLAKIKEQHSEEVYKNALQGLFANFLLLQAAAVNSKSKLDDGIVELVLEAVKQSAANNGIELL